MKQTKHPGMRSIEPTNEQMEAIKEQLIAKQFDEKYKIALEAVQFPAEHLPMRWFEAAATAMEFESPLSMGLDGPTMTEWYEAITPACKHDKPLNMYQVAGLNNIIEKRSARDLSLTMSERVQLFDLGHKVQQEWNAIAEPLRKKTVEDIRDSINLKQATNEQQKPVGQFGSVRAEA